MRTRTISILFSTITVLTQIFPTFALSAGMLVATGVRIGNYEFRAHKEARTCFVLSPLGEHSLVKLPGDILIHFGSKCPQRKNGHAVEYFQSVERLKDGSFAFQHSDGSGYRFDGDSGALRPLKMKDLFGE